MTGAWILPITYASVRPRFLASWDRYLLPRLFSRNLVVYGETFPIPEEMSEEAAVSRIGAAIDAATREADTAAGVSPPRPGREGRGSGERWNPVRIAGEPLSIAGRRRRIAGKEGER
jgi:hypothetical protein